MKKLVVLAMSGGVDSSVAALLLKQQGYDVHAFFMNAGQKTSRKWPSKIDWKKEESDLRKICDKLDIKDLFILDCEEGYEKKVISKMFKSYSQGKTPNPDILCNNVGKFPGLLKRAKAIGADFIATGHYAQVKKTKIGFELLEAKDKFKDQSYFICCIGQKYLRKLIFPLGDLTKSQVREIAHKNGFENFDKRSSRGICYLGNIDVKSFLKERIPSKEGKVLSPESKVIGTHLGTMYFTIGEKVGERHGIKLNNVWLKSLAKFRPKLFVAKKLPGNKLVIAPENHPILKTSQVQIKGFRLINNKEPIPGNLKARIRHLGEKHQGELKKVNNKWFFNFNQGVQGVAEGQYIVLYSGEKLVGSGEIKLK